MICKYCSDKKCCDIATENAPLQIECPSCNETGCDECDNGYINIMGCPNAYCREISPTIGLIDLFENGLPPISGGALDQSVWFIEAAKILSAETSRAKAELYAD